MRFELQPLIFMKSRLRDGLAAKGLLIELTMIYG